MGIPGIPFQPSQDSDNSDKKKRRSVGDDLRSIKNTYDNIQKTLRYVKVVAGAFNPTIAIVAVILVIILIVIFFFDSSSGGLGGGGGRGGGSEEPGGGLGGLPGAPQIEGFTLTLEGPNAVPNSSQISYTIRYTYNASAATIPLEDITIYDILPSNARLIEASGSWQRVDGNVAWNLGEPENSSPITIVLQPNGQDIEVANEVYAQALGANAPGGGGNLGGILPSSSVFSSSVDAAQQSIVNRIKGSPELIAAYQQAEAATGVYWQILAGIHYREGDLNGANSLVSGRPIGSNEPDIVRGGGCSSTYTPGEPVALPGGGCGFRTFADSAIYAANHFKGKNAGSVPSSFEALAKSLSYYNGGGNANCGKTPYPNCPPAFTGDDDTYVMSLFDQRHEGMYIVYCADFTLCNPPVRDQRLGVASVIMGLNRFY